jgi:endonuclease YncB( thermonuclease family)
MEKDPTSKMVIVWITDGGENLNVHLVRHGCVGAGQMLAVTDEDPDIQRGLGLEKDELEVQIAEYRTVRKQLIEAEEKAKQERLGIWAKPAEERTDD